MIDHREENRNLKIFILCEISRRNRQWKEALGDTRYLFETNLLNEITTQAKSQVNLKQFESYIGTMKSQQNPSLVIYDA